VPKLGRLHCDTSIAPNAHMSHCSAAQADGIEAYDCYYKEVVLLVPWLFGLPGDNPMQSELCSHIGMSGNLFCRMCKVSQASKVGTGKSAKVRSDEELLTEYLRVCTCILYGDFAKILLCRLELFVQRETLLVSCVLS
jgi:hypothetical protein